MHLTEIEKICTDADGTFLPAGDPQSRYKKLDKKAVHSLSEAAPNSIQAHFLNRGARR